MAVAKYYRFERGSIFSTEGPFVGDRKGTTKKLCDKDVAERSGELSGVILPQNPLFSG